MSKHRKTSENANGHKHARGAFGRFILAVGVAGLSALAALALMFTPAPQPEAPYPVFARAAQPSPETASKQRELFRRQLLWNTKIVPLLDQADKDYQQAVDDALEQLSLQLEAMRAGVAPFVEEIHEMGTRLHMLKHMGVDLAHGLISGEQVGRTAAEAYLLERMSAHGISEAALAEAVEQVLTQLAEDIRAIRNETLGQVQAAIDLAGLPVSLQGDFPAEVMREMEAMAGSLGRQTIVNGLFAFGAIAVTEEAVRIAVTRLAMWMAARAAQTAATPLLMAAGGATVSAAAAGGAGGSLAGPVGMAAGLTAGIIAGLALDMYLTERSSEQLRAKLHRYLDDTRHNLIEGHPGQPGLRALFAQDIALFRQAMNQQLNHQIIKGN